MEMQESIFKNKLLHFCAFTSSRLQNPKMDGLFLEAKNNLPQLLNKTIGIATGPLRGSLRSPDEMIPFKDIEPLPMLAEGMGKRLSGLD